MTEYKIRNLVMRFHNYNEEYKSIYVSLKRWVKSSNSKGLQFEAEAVYELIESFRSLCLEFIQILDKSYSSINRNKTRSCASLISECNDSLKSIKIADTLQSKLDGSLGCKMNSVCSDQIEIKLNQSSISTNANEKTSRFNKFVKYISPRNDAQKNSSNSLKKKSKVGLDLHNSFINEDLVTQTIYLKPTKTRKIKDTSLLKSINLLSEVSDSKIGRDLNTQTHQQTLQSTKENHILKNIIDKDINQISRTCITPSATSNRSNRLQSETRSFLTKAIVTSGPKDNDVKSVHLMSVTKETSSPNIRKLMNSLSKRLNTFKAYEISQGTPNED